MDVHQFTPNIKSVLNETREALKFYNIPEKIESCLWINLTNKWKQKSLLEKKLGAFCCLNNMVNSYNQKEMGYIDQDLDHDINIASIFYGIDKWSEKKDQIEREKIIMETLEEINTTCRQGHSHRFIQLFNILYFDEKKNLQP